MAKGLAPREATRKAMDEVTGPVIAITLVLCAVFIPTAFMAGISGQFYRQFALTIAASTIISAFNSLTLSPGARVRSCSSRMATDEHGQRQREALPRLGDRDADRRSGRPTLVPGADRWLGLSRLGGPRTARRPRPTQRRRALGMRAAVFAVGQRRRLVRRPALVNRVLGAVLRRLQLGLRPDDRRLRPHRGRCFCGSASSCCWSTAA